MFEYSQALKKERPDFKQNNKSSPETPENRTFQSFFHGFSGE